MPCTWSVKSWRACPRPLWGFTRIMVRQGRRSSAYVTPEADKEKEDESQGEEEDYKESIRKAIIHVLVNPFVYLSEYNVMEEQIYLSWTELRLIWKHPLTLKCFVLSVKVRATECFFYLCSDGFKNKSISEAWQPRISHFLSLLSSVAKHKPGESL